MESFYETHVYPKLPAYSQVHVLNITLWGILDNLNTIIDAYAYQNSK